MRYIFFFNDTATTEIYTLSLHDALPIFADDPQLAPWKEQYAAAFRAAFEHAIAALDERQRTLLRQHHIDQDRKSTRLNSSHGYISYAVFCLKKKNENISD